MAKKDSKARDIERKVHDLASAMKQVKHAQADRDDVVVEIRQAKASRLELLADDLQSVFADIPKHDERFEIALMRGDTPRLWIDMTTFVRMGRDGRGYELVKDTRLGRTLLANSEDREKIGKNITAYIAERLLERERDLEGEWVALRSLERVDGLSTADEEKSGEGNQNENTVENKTGAGLSALSAFIWFLFGLVIGLAVFSSAFIFDQFHPLVEWLADISQ